MDPVRDPEENEPKQLREYADLEHARVIEIGTGNGRMTWRYASLTKSVAGIDPEFDRLKEAVDDRPKNFAPEVYFAQAKAEALPFKDSTFDGAIFAWSF
ncbi:MAG: class I SAM-dependent methyltransferase [Chloroflexi bacterium]|nr:class I SAM-dependent methyltransferase [Chloroflexota bacterium]